MSNDELVQSWNELDGYILMTELDEITKIFPEPNRLGHNCWLVHEETVVAYAHFFLDESSRHAEVSIIEVHPDHRRKGYAKEIVDAIEAVFFVNLHSKGEYTMEGYEKLAHWLPLMNGDMARVTKQPTSHVISWDELTVQL